MLLVSVLPLFVLWCGVARTAAKTALCCCSGEGGTTSSARSSAAGWGGAGKAIFSKLLDGAWRKPVSLEEERMACCCCCTLFSCCWSRISWCSVSMSSGDSSSRASWGASAWPLCTCCWYSWYARINWFAA